MKKLTAVSMMVNGKNFVIFTMLETHKRADGDIKTVIDQRNYCNIMALAGAHRGDTVSH